MTSPAAGWKSTLHKTWSELEDYTVLKTKRKTGSKGDPVATINRRRLNFDFLFEIHASKLLGGCGMDKTLNGEKFA